MLDINSVLKQLVFLFKTLIKGKASSIFQHTDFLKLVKLTEKFWGTH